VPQAISCATQTGLAFGSTNVRSLLTERGVEEKVTAVGTFSAPDLIRTVVQLFFPQVACEGATRSSSL
jgi:hypothetical protein